MSPSRNESTKNSLYILIVGSILTLIPNIPVINQIFPIYRFVSFIVRGGVSFLESFYEIGSFQGSFDLINKWTVLGLEGELLWIIFTGISIAGLFVGLLLKSKSLVTVVGLGGGLIEIILSVLIFIGDSTDANAFGLSNFANTNVQQIGIGFWLLLLGSILTLASGLIAMKK